MKTSNRSLALRWAAALLLLVVATLPLAGVRAQTAPTLKVDSPSNGAKITANDITVQVETSNFKVDCTQMGRPDQSGSGEILAFIDGTTIAQLANFYCTDAPTRSPFPATV